MFLKTHLLNWDHDIIHRDLKWANVVLNKKGHVRIIDFSWANKRSEATKENLRDVPYSSEIIEAWNMRTDIYCLVHMMYELKVYDEKKTYQGFFEVDEHFTDSIWNLGGELTNLSYGEPSQIDFLPSNVLFSIVLCFPC